MKTVKTTITSKNQITIPSHIVRSLKLNRNRRLQIKQRGNDIVLTPLPSLEDSLKPVWQRAAKTTKKPLSDAEIQSSVRNIAANRGQ